MVADKDSESGGKNLGFCQFQILPNLQIKAQLRKELSKDPGKPQFEPLLSTS